jgi:hypothetical protein
MKKSINASLGISILWFVIACSLSVVIWGNVSLPAKIAFFAAGFASGISLGAWVCGRRKDSRQ